MVNGEDRLSPWASYVLQPPREKQQFEGEEISDQWIRICMEDADPGGKKRRILARKNAHQNFTTSTFIFHSSAGSQLHPSILLLTRWHVNGYLSWSGCPALVFGIRIPFLRIQMHQFSSMRIHNTYSLKIVFFKSKLSTVNALISASDIISAESFF